MTFRWEKAVDQPQPVVRVRRDNNPHVELVKAVKIKPKPKQQKPKHIPYTSPYDSPKPKRGKTLLLQGISETGRKRYSAAFRVAMREAICHNENDHFKEEYRAVGVLRDDDRKPWNRPGRRKIDKAQKPWGYDLPVCGDCLEDSEGGRGYRVIEW